MAWRGLNINTNNEPPKTYRDHYFFVYPDCQKIDGGDGYYPANKNGSCLCAKEAGYVDRCFAGEGFFDCRDCWNGRIK